MEALNTGLQLLLLFDTSVYDLESNILFNSCYVILDLCNLSKSKSIDTARFALLETYASSLSNISPVRFSYYYQNRADTTLTLIQNSFSSYNVFHPTF